GSEPQVLAATPPPSTPRPTAVPVVPVASTPPSSSSVSVTSFREEDLRFIETELAKHIGPFARVLVKKAAKTAANLNALATALVDNIPEEEGRRAFRSAIRTRAK
ncbi:MAG TPA: hypothetical protein VF376_03310, partial [Thermoanaerobaculia bacterium]